MVEAGVTDSEFRRYWIFQGMPDQYDLEESLIAGEVEPWPLTRYRQDILPGDIVYFWRGGRRPGLYGWGEVVDQPDMASSKDAQGRAEFAAVRYHVRFREPLSRDELLERDSKDANLAGLMILRTPQGTNFKMTTREAYALAAILRDRGDEAPLDPAGIGANEFPAGNLLPINFGRSAARVVGAGLTPAFDSLTGVALFNALMALPYSNQAPSRGIVLFLREFFGEGKFEPGALIDYLEKPMPLTRDALADRTMSSEALFIVETARMLAINSTGGREEIGLRHLLGSILMVGTGGLLDMIDADCMRSGHTLEDLVGAFADFVVDAFPQDDSNTWLSRWRPGVEQSLEDFRRRRIRSRQKGSVEFETETGATPPKSSDADDEAMSERESETAKADDLEEDDTFEDLDTTPAFARVFARRPLTDRPSGHDLLKIEQEVRALAHLFALSDTRDNRDQDPEDSPSTFALGLFGRWGAGKSFFINKMKRQIATYADQARTSTSASPYCKHIEQIEFNAWHYNEADIWASLVHHIFDSLQKRFEREQQEKEFRNLISRLEISQQQREEIERERRAKRKERRLVARAIADMQTRIEENIENQMRKMSVLGRVAASDSLRNELSGVLTQAQSVLGLPRSGDGTTLNTATESAHELLGALQESGVLAARSQSTARTIVQSAFTRNFLIAAGLVLAVYVSLPFVPGWENVWDTVFKGVHEGVVAAVPVLAWFGHKLKQTNGVFDRISGIETALREQIRRDEEAKNAELATLRLDHARLENEIGDGAKKLAAVDEEIREIEARLEELGSPESLVDFINERASSDDYRSKLGILALIRSDFERLSRIMLDRRVGNDDAPLPNLDRIILYIDDLDRVQRSDKVLQVLEAVHLLLAFPLFHVVVAVDERWAARSVLQHHKAFFELPEEEDKQDDSTQTAAKTRKGKTTAVAARIVPNAALQAFIAGTQSATPREFLEKIFQICFWVRPLSTQLTHELINGMVRGDEPKPDREPTVAAEAMVGHTFPVNAPPTVSEEPGLDEAANIGNSFRVPDVKLPTRSTTIHENGQMVPDDPTVTSGSVVAHRMEHTSDKPDAEDDDADATNGANAYGEGSSVPDLFDAGDFDISEEELISMRALSRLIGRSPRTVKRFINTYKLFKAMRIPPGTGGGTDEAYGPDDIATDHVPIMILLAIQIGHPDVAFQLFNAFDAALEADDSQSIGQVIKTLQTAVPSDVNPDKWQAVLDSFYSVHDLWGDDPTLIDIGIAALDPWLLGTSRFGFKEWVPDADRLWG